MAGWLGPDVVKSLLLDKMPDMMRKDTEKLVEEAGTGARKQPQRFTRKEAVKRANAAPSAAAIVGVAAAATSGHSGAAEADANDMVSIFQCAGYIVLLIQTKVAACHPDGFTTSPVKVELWMRQGVDAYEIAEPVEVLGRLDKAFWEGLASAKWSERRNALQSLKQLSSSPKLAPGDYADVVRELRKVASFSV